MKTEYEIINGLKVAKNDDEAWKIQNTFEGKPHGWIQWKGTNVCVDIHCACGEVSHYDGDFMYSIKCPACERIHFCNGHIELIELEEVPQLLKTAESGDDPK